MNRFVGGGVIALIALAAGCKEGSKAAGSYSLISRGGAALPAPARFTTETQDCRIDLLSGQLVLRGDGTWKETLVNNYGCAPKGAPIPTATTVFPDSGTFTLSPDGRVDMVGAGMNGTPSSHAGVWNGDTLRLEYLVIGEGGPVQVSLVYLRHP